MKEKGGTVISPVTAPLICGPQAKTDVSKVNSESPKYKSPALWHVSCTTSQKAGQDEKTGSKRATGAVH